MSNYNARTHQHFFKNYPFIMKITNQQEADRFADELIAQLKKLDNKV